MLNFDRSTVKNGTQNIQNDCHQWFSGSFRVHQIRPGSAPDTTEGAYSSQDPLAGLRGPISKREAEVEGERKGRKEGERKGKGGTSHFQIPGSAPGYCGNRGSGTSLH